MLRSQPLTRNLCRAPASITALVICAALLTGGCGQKKEDTKKQGASATPKPSATSAPLPVNVAVEGLQSTLFDKNGQIVAQISAKEAATGTKNAQGAARPEGLGLLKTAHAVYSKTENRRRKWTPTRWKPTDKPELLSEPATCA